LAPSTIKERSQFATFTEEKKKAKKSQGGGFGKSMTKYWSGVDPSVPERVRLPKDSIKQ